MLGRGGEIAVCVLAVPTTLCALLAGLNLHNEIWRQWSEKSGWVGMGAGAVHSEIILVIAAVVLVNFVLLLAVGIWWSLNARKPGFPHRGFAAWFALLLVSAASYFPTSRQYAAGAVLVFGPGPKSQEFQIRAAERDSIVLLDALILRGATLDEGVLCAAARYDSPHVINRLIERSVPVNAECYTRKTTALHEAVAAKLHGNAEILMKAGAKADLPDARGSTPLDIARRQTDDRMIRILTEAGQSATPDAKPRQ